MHSGPIHERIITIKTFELNDDTLAIEGSLIDNRLCKTLLYLTSTVADPKTIHHISFKMEISLPNLTVTSAHMDMHEVPHTVCRDIRDIGSRIVGTSLLGGFNGSVRESMGGKNGCLHLYNLLLSMRAAAFQGLFTYLCRVQEDGSVRKMIFDESLLVNSCHVWDESGPMVQAMKAAGRARLKK